MNSLKALGSEVGEALLTAAAPALEDLGGFLKDAADKFADLDDNQKTFAVRAGVALAAAGPVMSGIGRLTEGIGGVALPEYVKQTIEKNGLDIDVITGATVTLDGYKEAVNAALSQALS
jgi:hypothetical protein